MWLINVLGQGKSRIYMSILLVPRVGWGDQTGPLTRLKHHQPILPPTNESRQTVRRESTDEINKRTVVECFKLICYIIYFYILSLNLLHWFKLESVPCLHFVFYRPIFMLGLYSFLFASTIQSSTVKDYW